MRFIENSLLWLWEQRSVCVVDVLQYKARQQTRWGIQRHIHICDCVCICICPPLALCVWICIWKVYLYCIVFVLGAASCRWPHLAIVTAITDYSCHHYHCLGHHHHYSYHCDYWFLCKWSLFHAIATTGQNLWAENVDWALGSSFYQRWWWASMTFSALWRLKAFSFFSIHQKCTNSWMWRTCFTADPLTDNLFYLHPARLLWGVSSCIVGRARVIIGTDLVGFFCKRWFVICICICIFHHYWKRSVFKLKISCAKEYF